MSTKRTQQPSTLPRKRLTKENLCATVETIAQEWLCPITQELPLNPVTAEDGRVYERSTIGTWLNQQAGRQKKKKDS